jgi:AraC-like DNA-binding protein
MDPMSNVHHHLKGFVYYCEGKYEQAIDYFEKSLELQYRFVPSVLYLGQAILLSGDLEKGLKYFEGLDEELFEEEKVGGVALAMAMMNNVEEAKKGIRDLEEGFDADLRERILLLQIQVYAALGRFEEALQGIEEARQARHPMLVYYFVEPLLKSLRQFDKFRELQNEVVGDMAPIERLDERQRKYVLKKQELDTLQKKLDGKMADSKPYLDPSLSLRSLAEQINLTPNKLSQLLNEGYRKNFSEFVNDYRLEEFKTLVKESSKNHLTMLALAFESGFNSKTVFNTYFKKSMGITPREFWKKAVNKE